MQSNKILYNLILYVIVFTIVVFFVGNILIYYFNNLNKTVETENDTSQITKFDLYMLKTVKSNDVQIRKTGITDDEKSYFITFQSGDDNINSFIKKGNNIYYNQIKLCENVDSFKVIVDKSEKESLNVEIGINSKLYTLQYVID